MISWQGKITFDMNYKICDHVHPIALLPASARDPRHRAGDGREMAFPLPMAMRPGHSSTMIQRRNFLLFCMALATPALAQQRSIGIFGTWGAFRGDGRCHAVAEPYQPPRAGDGRGFASVGYWIARPVRGQVYFRLSRAKREGSAVLLRIDRRTFQLRGGHAEAWAADPAADSEIVSAMRTGIEMSVETRAASGALVRDSYRLRGAATAIDAAAIACAGRG